MNGLAANREMSNPVTAADAASAWPWHAGHHWRGPGEFLRSVSMPTIVRGKSGRLQARARRIHCFKLDQLCRTECLLVC